MEKYHPISCSFVDHIEHFATKRALVFIEYLNSDSRTLYVVDQIKDWRNKAGVEYVILKSGLEIRMDYLKSVGGEVLEGSCGV